MVCLTYSDFCLWDVISNTQTKTNNDNIVFVGYLVTDLHTAGLLLNKLQGLCVMVTQLDFCSVQYFLF